MKKTSGSTGRLSQALNPIALSIVYPSQDEAALANELRTLIVLTEAHLVSLSKSNLLSPAIIRTLLKTIVELKVNNFAPLFERPVERGIYLLLESYLIDTLGMETAGSLHIGRSRNDINATAFKLNLRSFFSLIHDNLSELRSVLLKQAHLYTDLAMPIYSQFQVAQIGTYAYYLLAIEEAIARDQRYLQQLFFSLDECPIGAVAGCGTSFPIDHKFTASLLGFSQSCSNALDAVASRDLALRMLSGVSVLGTTLSRIAQDYQLWTMQELAFFELPDNLSGGSSVMPQKKNPYLFEIIKGRSASLNGLLVQAFTAMHNVPFSNSVEVGTEALKGMDVALKNVCDILTLSTLLMSGIKPIEAHFTKSITNGVAVAASVAEFLVKEQKLPFRLAHYEIGARITKAIKTKTDPNSAIFELTDSKLKDLEVNTWAFGNEYGGGPGKVAIDVAYQSAELRLLKGIDWITSIKKQWASANDALQLEINKIIKG